jgi:hypothetical protein
MASPGRVTSTISVRWTLPCGVLLGLFLGCWPVGIAHADPGVDCPDFSSSRDAQDYYEEQGGVSGGDPDDLDRDDDGNACDWGTDEASDQSTKSDGGTAPPITESGDSSGFPWWGWPLGVFGLLWIGAGTWEHFNP